jgi:hypothetical protein
MIENLDENLDMTESSVKSRSNVKLGIWSQEHLRRALKAILNERMNLDLSDVYVEEWELPTEILRNSKTMSAVFSFIFQKSIYHNIYFRKPPDGLRPWTIEIDSNYQCEKERYDIKSKNTEQSPKHQPMTTWSYIESRLLKHQPKG